MELTLDAPDEVTRRSPVAMVADRIGGLLRQPWFAYFTLLALQLKRIWGIWDYRELTGGDTCSYFVDAYGWFTHWKTNFPWSPLYTAFYGTFLYVTQDVAAATVLHRIAIVLAATMLVLAVLRKMLPPEMAWLVAAWWAVLPINFNTMYEVHLFALLPLLVALLLVMSGRGPWSRGAAVAVLVLDTFLVRNETVIAAGCLILVCWWWERRQGRRSISGYRIDLPLILVLALLGFLAFTTRENGIWMLALVTLLCTAAIWWERRRRQRSILFAYGIPIVLAISVIGFAYHQSILKGKKLHEEVNRKHTVNMGQVFAFGYQQRHPHKWKNRNPWTDFPELCRIYFKTDAPTLWQMVTRKPSAVIAHFGWNFRLVPEGLQLMLFNAVSGGLNPDYDGRVKLHKTYPLVLGLIAILIVVVGALILWKDPENDWRAWIRSRRLSWLAMLCIAATALLIIPTQRPRPSYLFGLSVVLMTVVGTAALVILSRFPRLKPLVALMPIAMVLLPVLLPSHWAHAGLPGPGSLLATYERLKPYQPLIDQKGRVFLEGDHGPEINNYLGFGHGRSTLQYDVFGKLNHDVTLGQFLDSQQITLFYLDTHCWQNLDAQYPGLVREFILTPQITGWRMIGSGEDDHRWLGSKDPTRQYRWALFVRTQPGEKGSPDQAFEAFPGTDQFGGWYPVANFQEPEGPYPRANLPYLQWGLGPTSKLATRDTKSGRYVLEFCGLTTKPDQHVTVVVDGKPCGRFDLPAGTWPEHRLPLDLSPGRHEIEFRYTTWQEPTPTLKQAVLFRRLRIVRAPEGAPAAEHVP